MHLRRRFNYGGNAQSLITNQPSRAALMLRHKPGMNIPHPFPPLPRLRMSVTETLNSDMDQPVFIILQVSSQRPHAQFHHCIAS